MRILKTEWLLMDYDTKSLAMSSERWYAVSMFWRACESRWNSSQSRIFYVSIRGLVNTLPMITTFLFFLFSFFLSFSFDSLPIQKLFPSCRSC